jgi:hypothetical protein
MQTSLPDVLLLRQPCLKSQYGFLAGTTAWRWAEKQQSGEGVCAVLASLLIGAIEPAGAASWSAVKPTIPCATPQAAPLQNARKIYEAGDFIRAQCKNGQLLVGSGIVPAGGFDSEVVRLARTFCHMADIQASAHTGQHGPASSWRSTRYGAPSGSADMRKALLAGLLAVVAANVVAADGGAPLRGGVCIGPFRGADSVLHCESNIGKVTIRQIYKVRLSGSFSMHYQEHSQLRGCWLSRSRRAMRAKAWRMLFAGRRWMLWLPVPASVWLALPEWQHIPVLGGLDSLLARVVAQRWLRGHVQVAGNRRASVSGG